MSNNQAFVAIFFFRIQDWIDRLGSELWIFADLVTRQKQVQEVSDKYCFITDCD